MPLRALPALAAALLAMSTAAGAHPASDTADAWAWSFEPWVVGCLLLSAGLYVRGLWRLWTHAGYARGIGTWQAASFALGWTALAASLVSPLDTIGGELFSVHMLQHELLMLIAAPLMVIGRPLATWTWALPFAWRQRAGSAAAMPPLAVAWRLLTAPLVAWACHALALWVWHAPVLFEAALRSPAVHALQHASFLFSALLFWWALLGTPRSVAAPGATAYLFTTMIHTGALGALMTVATRPWYPSYAAHVAAWGLSPLEDQQLGGLIMWIPAGAIYAAAGLMLIARWLAGDRRSARAVGQAAT